MEYVLVKIHDESSRGCLSSQQAEEGQVGQHFVVGCQVSSRKNTISMSLGTEVGREKRRIEGDMVFASYI